MYRARVTHEAGTSDEGSFEDTSAAWEHLIDIHEGTLRRAGLSVDRVLRRMESRSDNGMAGIVSGPDPLNPADTITYSVQVW